MTTSWLCCDLPTAIADAFEHGTLDNLTGAEPVDDSDRAAAYELLRVEGDGSPAATDLLRRLAPLVDPYPEASAPRMLSSAPTPNDR